MRRRLYGLSVLLPLFFGCAGKNVVAGEDKTKAEQLAAVLPSWCQTTCTRLRACPVNTDCTCSGDVCDCGARVDAKCEAQCQDAFAAYTNAGESCAAVGERFKTCVDAIQCSQLNGNDPCAVTDAERSECPDPNASGSDSVDAPASAGGLVDNPGTSVGGASAGHAGANPVTCPASYGTGGGASASDGSRVTCEEGRDNCTDGHAYSWLCALDSQGRRACSCLVDAHATAGFEPVSDCPDLSAVNAGCGWALTQ